MHNSWEAVCQLARVPHLFDRKNMPSEDSIAAAVHACYARLPKTGKPADGAWTCLAGVVLSRVGSDDDLAVVALGTGTKCLTADQVAADGAGECVHDGHAEVCARRALREYLLSELIQLYTAGGTSTIFERRASSIEGGATLHPDIRLHFYTSEPPCGDASIFALPDAEAAGATTALPSDETAVKNDTADVVGGEPAMKRARHGSTTTMPSSMLQLGRTGAKPARASAMEAEAASVARGCLVCELSLVRTKPGRGVRTCCMSCSDKIARWNAIGLQGALLSLLVPSPICFASITVSGPPCALGALQRALTRACAAAGSSTTGLTPRLGCSQLRFPHGAPESGDAINPCSNSIVWAKGTLHEALNGLIGKKLGCNPRNPSPKHRSRVCKALVMQRFHELLSVMGRDRLPACLREHAVPPSLSYAELKALALTYQRRKRECVTGGGAALADWIKAPVACEDFKLQAGT